MLTGKALHYNPKSWLFYVSLPLATNDIASNTIQTPECTYAIMAEDETEFRFRTLLPITKDYDAAYALMQTNSNPKTQQAQLKLWHERLGHPHFAKVAAILGLPALAARHLHV